MVSKKEKKDKNQMIIEGCICKKCPSWIECNEQGGFCSSSIGKSKCILEEKGCICGGCPVYDKMKLSHMYYCIRGFEEEQK
jgi:hypothetical protein